MMALEEPETHLHPQAQRALFRQIKKMPGQCIISTHSPYICGQAEIGQMRHFSKLGEATIVSRIELEGLERDDLRKIDRQVMNTRGDMLFARTLVFFEGETEEQSLPDFAEKFWRKHPNDLGYSFIGVGGNVNYLPFLRMAQSFRIPWFIFSDGESETVTAVNVALKAIGEKLIPENTRVIVLPEKKDFEAYIVTDSSKDLLIDAIIEHEAKRPQHAEALKRAWASKPKDEQIASILVTLDANKTQYGSILGKVLPVPTALEDLFKKVDAGLTPSTLGGMVT
jgi:putative ATP-dependent endonuclease of the OLD family